MQSHETEPGPELEPFFIDPRTLREKMAAEEEEWRPTDSQFGSPPMVAGLVLERDVFISTLGPEPEEKPTIRLLEWPANIEWKAIGFHGWLKRELEMKNPQPGDYAVLSYVGVKPATKPGHNDGHMYRSFVERNPEGRVAPIDPDDDPSERYAYSDDLGDALVDEAADEPDAEEADDDIPF
jgi:hypothetical protein